MSSVFFPEALVSVTNANDAVLAPSVVASVHRDTRKNLLEILISKGLGASDLTRCYKLVIDQLVDTLPSVGGYVLIESFVNGVNQHMLGNWAIWDESETDPGIDGMLASTTVFIMRNI